jgi:hypothetical protein
MSEIVTTVAGLSDEQALEAINLLSFDVLGATPDATVLARIAEATGQDTHSVRMALEKSTPEQIADLARVVLIAYAAESPDEVCSAIENSGRKAVILELIVGGILALGVGQLAVTKGRSKTSTETTTKVDKDGNVTTRTKTDTTYFSVGQALAPLVKAVIERFLNGGSGS